jgi:hypothetical protein
LVIVFSKIETTPLIKIARIDSVLENLHFVFLVQDTKQINSRKIPGKFLCWRDKLGRRRGPEGYMPIWAL